MSEKPLESEVPPQETEKSAADDSNMEVQGSVEEQLAQIQQEAELLKQMQAQFTQAQEEVKENKEEVDARSIYVGNVEYAAQAADLQKLFSSCGNINRINIMMDKWTGNPKGFAYVEFEEPSMVTSALSLNDTELLGRQIKVLPKRTNVHGYNQRGRGRGRGYRNRGGYRGRGYYKPY